MDFHRLVLYVSLGLGTLVLAINAYSVVSGNSWLFARYVQ